MKYYANWYAKNPKIPWEHARVLIYNGHLHNILLHLARYGHLDNFEWSCNMHIAVIGIPSPYEYPLNAELSFP